MYCGFESIPLKDGGLDSIRGPELANNVVTRVVDVVEAVSCQHRARDQRCRFLLLEPDDLLDPSQKKIPRWYRKY
eukprot:1108407-Amphidinium_carterae.1